MSRARARSFTESRDENDAAMVRMLVLALGFVLCLVGAGGLVMDDMGHREADENPFTSSAVVRAAAGGDREVPLPAAASGAILALGMSVTLAVARRG